MSDIEELRAQNIRLVAEIARLRAQLADKPPYVDLKEAAAMRASLEEAWAELDRKQAQLEDCVRACAELSGKADRVESLEASLHEAWAELDNKQRQLEDAVRALAEAKAGSGTE